MKVYIDTSAILAILNADDDFHLNAVPLWFELLKNETVLVTNSFVLVEIFALLQNRLGLDAVRTFANDIVPLLELKWINADLYQQTVTAYLGSSRRQLSLVDCSSFIVMRRWNIMKAFTFDRHFEEQGFEVLRVGLQ